MKDAHPFVYNREPYKQRPLNSILGGSHNPFVVREKLTITSGLAQSVEFLSEPLIICKSTQDPPKCVSRLLQIFVRWFHSIRISKACMSQQNAPVFPRSKLIDSFLNPPCPDQSIQILKQNPRRVDEFRPCASGFNGKESDFDGPCGQGHCDEQQQRNRTLPG